MTSAFTGSQRPFSTSPARWGRPSGSGCGCARTTRTAWLAGPDGLARLGATKTAETHIERIYDKTGPPPDRRRPCSPRTRPARQPRTPRSVGRTPDDADRLGLYRHSRGVERTDQCGYQVTGLGAAGVERFDAAVRSLLLFADDVGDAWESTVAEEPAFALGHIGRAYLRCLSSEAPDAADARTILASLGDGHELSDRERRHLDAARSYATGDLHGAAARLDALSVEYPHDLLALAVGHQLDFFCGDSQGLRDRPARVLSSWDHGHPLFGFVLGMHAFGLEETNLYPRAETVGMRALDAEPLDVWALHAVVHVHEMQNRVEAGLRFMDERRAHWSTGNFFVVHNAWHEALFRLEAGDLAGALAIYDAMLHHDRSAKVALEMLDATALLWRMHLDGIDVGDRWSTLSDAWAEKASNEPWYAFNDMHAAMAFAATGRLDDLRAVLARLQRYSATAQPSVANLAMTADVGVPVCEAMLAFAEGRYDDTVRALHPIRRMVHRFGGSNAQRDVVARTLLEATIRGSDGALARALVSERLAVKESSSYNRRQLDRASRVDSGTAPAVVAGV
jgi:hypothetical protein